jgi:Flp pilus assembly protein TadB
MTVHLLALALMALTVLFCVMYTAYYCLAYYKSERLMGQVVAQLQASTLEFEKQYRYLSGMQQRIGQKIQAVVPLACVFFVVCCTFVLYQWHGSKMMTLLMLVASMIAFGFFAVQHKKKRERLDLLQQLPNRINVFVNYYNSNLSMEEIIEKLALDSPMPIKGYFVACNERIQSGELFTQAAFKAAQRYKSVELDFFALLLELHLQSNQVMKQTMIDWAEAIRKRQSALAKVRSLSLQSRYSFYILALLPPAVLAFYTFSQQGRLDVLFTTESGQILMVVACLLYTVGFVLGKVIFSVIA